jgi:hypothetical protein
MSRAIDALMKQLPPGVPPLCTDHVFDYIKLSEAARLLDCHPSVVQRLALRGMIRTRTVLGRVMYHHDDINDLKDADSPCPPIDAA